MVLSNSALIHGKTWLCLFSPTSLGCFWPSRRIPRAGLQEDHRQTPFLRHGTKKTAVLRATGGGKLKTNTWGLLRLFASWRTSKGFGPTCRSMIYRTVCGDHDSSTNAWRQRSLASRFSWKTRPRSHWWLNHVIISSPLQCFSSWSTAQRE